MERIFMEDIKKGKFENGKEELFVVFKNNRNEYFKWRPRWIEEVIRLVDEASATEALNDNSNCNHYLGAFADSAKSIR